MQGYGDGTPVDSAFNLMGALQACTAERRRTNRERQALWAFRMIHTLRYQFVANHLLYRHHRVRASLSIHALVER